MSNITFYKHDIPNPTILAGKLNELVTEDDTAVEPLCFTALDAGATIEILNNGGNTPNIEYSVDNKQTWTTWDYSTITLANSGDTVYMRGNNIDGFSRGTGKYSRFSITMNFDISGNILSLIGPDINIIPRYCFYNIFNGCSTLIHAHNLDIGFNDTELNFYCCAYMFSFCTNLITTPKLPDTTLDNGCYSYMFYHCTSLSTVPELPATTLASGCYSYMFQGCTSLETVHELPATTLEYECYRNMFYGCRSLTTVPQNMLPATTLADYCYYYMFSDCTSLTTTPKLPATTLADRCYVCMFSYCTSLTSAPVLSATTLANYCYNSMFYNCTNLTNAPELPATTLAPSCYSGMFSYCRSLTTAPVLSATTLENYCYQSMFTNCTSLTTVPELPATTLASGCYSYMFAGCSNLNYIKCLATNTNASNCITNWVNGVQTNNGTFIKNPAMQSWTTGDDGIPSGWTVYNYHDEISIDKSLFKNSSGSTSMPQIYVCDVDYSGNKYYEVTTTATNVQIHLTTPTTLTAFEGVKEIVVRYRNYSIFSQNQATVKIHSDSNVTLTNLFDTRILSSGVPISPLKYIELKFRFWGIDDVTVQGNLEV